MCTMRDPPWVVGSEDECMEDNANTIIDYPIRWKRIVTSLITEVSLDASMWR